MHLRNLLPVLLAGLIPVAVFAAEDDFAAQMDAAMARMHAAMAIAYSGNPDRDFARMMIPHHQGAIEMAELELRYGKDERLRRLAQKIIVEQRQEIMVMQSTLGNEAAPPAGAPDHMGHGDHK